MRVVAVVDGTVGTAGRQARALGGFLRDGLVAGAREGVPGGLTEETLVVYHDEEDRDGLVGLSPTCDVRLVRTARRRVDRMVEVLTSAPRGEQPSLFLFAPGPTGTELAARLACRTGGAVLTEALSAEIGPAGLACRKNVYSAHMTGRFELATRPWCVTVDAGWYDAPDPAGVAHRVLSDSDEMGETGASPFEDVELLETPSSEELAEARFLVVAGYGAGDRERVERIAAAARRMGADFGVSRPVATNAWAPMDRLIGVSGTRTAPALCLVVGASGAPAFHWGIEKAGFIVAINPDERAAIVGNADAAVLDDGVAVIEELAAIIAAERKRPSAGA